MKELDVYTDDEKIEWFDRMYNNAREQYLYVLHNGRTHAWKKQITWEVVIELLGDDIWDRWKLYSYSTEVERDQGELVPAVQ